MQNHKKQQKTIFGINNIVFSIFSSLQVSNTPELLTPEHINTALQWFHNNPHQKKYSKKESNLPYSFIHDIKGNNFFVIGHHKLGQGGFGRIKTLWRILPGNHPTLKKLHLVKVSRENFDENKLAIMNEMLGSEVVMIERPSSSQKKYREDNNVITYQWKKLYILDIPYAGLDHIVFLTELRHRTEDNFAKKKKIVLTLMIGAFIALYYLHQKGIIHQDVKPENFAINEELKTTLIDLENLGKKGGLPTMGTKGYYPSSMSDVLESGDENLIAEYIKKWSHIDIDVGEALDLYGAIVGVNNIFEVILHSSIQNEEGITEKVMNAFDIDNIHYDRDEFDGLYRGKSVDALFLAVSLICLAHHLTVGGILDDTIDAKKAREELLKYYDGFNKISLLDDPLILAAFRQGAKKIISEVTPAESNMTKEEIKSSAMPDTFHKVESSGFFEKSEKTFKKTKNIEKEEEDKNHLQESDLQSESTLLNLQEINQLAKEMEKLDDLISFIGAIWLHKTESVILDQSLIELEELGNKIPHFWCMHFASKKVCFADLDELQTLIDKMITCCHLNLKKVQDGSREYLQGLESLKMSPKKFKARLENQLPLLEEVKENLTQMQKANKFNPKI